MKYQCLMIDDDVTIAETTAEYFNIFDISTNYFFRLQKYTNKSARS